MFAALHERQRVLTTPTCYLPKQLYGLYKFVTLSRTPNTSRPGLLDFTGKAKWDSWQEIGKKYSTQPDPDGVAQARYLEIAKSLGWEPGTTAGDVLLDQDNNGERGSMKGVVTGTGVFVSTMSAPKDDNGDDLGTIHGLAIAGDAQKMEEILKADPSLDLNQKDGFASPFTAYSSKFETEGRDRLGIHCFALSVRQGEFGNCTSSPKARGGPDTQGKPLFHGLLVYMR